MPVSTDQQQIYTNSYPQYDPNVSYHGYDLSRDVSEYRFGQNNTAPVKVLFQWSIHFSRDAFRINPSQHQEKHDLIKYRRLTRPIRRPIEVNGRDASISSFPVWDMLWVLEPFGVFLIFATAMEEVKNTMKTFEQCDRPIRIEMIWFRCFSHSILYLSLPLGYSTILLGSQSWTIHISRSCPMLENGTNL